MCFYCAYWDPRWLKCFKPSVPSEQNKNKLTQKCSKLDLCLSTPIYVVGTR